MYLFVKQNRFLRICLLWQMLHNLLHIQFNKHMDTLIYSFLKLYTLLVSHILEEDQNVYMINSFTSFFHKTPWSETNLERDLLLRRSADRLLCRPEEGLLFLSPERLLDLDLLADFFFSSSFSAFSSFFSSVPFSLTESFTLQQENNAATFHTA